MLDLILKMTIFADVLRTLKAKLYPNSCQTRQLVEYLDQARFVFNKCLEQRQTLWREEKTGMGRFEQQKHLAKWRSVDPRLSATPSQIERDAIHRVDLAFQGFFRRVKAGQKPGYPRFKGRNRYNSFTISECGTILKTPSHIYVSGIKKPIRARGLQQVIGKIKNLTIVRRAGNWFARILVDDGLELPKKESITKKKSIGLDMGLRSFVTTSDGLHINAPKFYRKLESKLRRASRHVSRCKRGSNGRKKAILRLQKVHARIEDHRTDFLHQLSRLFVNKYSFIAAENLNIRSMVRSKFAKSILDAGWGEFLWMLSYKAERAGKTFIQVDARNTSQECAGCGRVVKKDLSERTHKCPYCDLKLDRDVNAARVVLARGLLTPPSGSDGVKRTEGRKTLPRGRAAPLKFAGS